MTKSATRVAADEVSAPIASPSFTGNVGINETSPAANLHLGASSPHIDIGPSGANRGKIGFNSNNVYIGSTSGAGEIHFKNNISSNDAPNSSGDTKMVISDSAVIIGNGVTLGNGNTYGAANTLDDYETGTWTPTISAYSGTNPTIAGTFSGTYTKIGNRVILSFYGGGVSASGVTSGILKFGGVPFTINDTFSTGSWTTHLVNFARPVLGALTNIGDGIGHLSCNDGGSWSWENVSILGSNVSFRASYSYLTNS